MTTTVRFKEVLNTTGAALTSAGVASNDGDEKALKKIKRVLVAADIGANAGQTQHGQGCLVDVLAPGTTVISLSGESFKVSNATERRRLDNLTLNSGAQIASLKYFINASNEIRVIDAGNNAAVQLAAGDVVSVEIVTGYSNTTVY